ncbi:DUF4283 domain-containing protein [Citrus sinensis]|nr:DUF4283 domain-containing protein [Citrus sinensis]
MDADNPPLLSFKDALMPCTQQRNFDDTEMDEEWDSEPGDVSVGDDGAMPTIKFSQQIHEKLVKPWQNSVVVKLLGRNIGYKVLCNRLEVMWHMIPDFSIIDLENNYFLIRLNSPEDAVYALTKGPWVIFGHYLTVQPWTPQFDSIITEIASVIVWIRLPGMVFHLYDKRILRKIGQLVGNVIKIDYHTKLRERGKFARIAFNLDGRIQKVEYEGLPIICYQCGKYGHNSTICVNRQNSTGVNKANSEISPLANASVAKIGVSNGANNTSERFGPWMVVARKGRPRVVVDKENIIDSERNQQNNFNISSRFAALSDDHDAITVEEFAVQNPIHVSPQQPSTSITDHFNSRKNTTLKIFRTLKPHNHLSKGQSPSEKTAANPEQHLLPKQLAEPPDGKDEKDGNIMANYEGDSQPVFGHDGEDIMSDDENTVVNETPGVHEGMTVGLSA